MKKLVGLFMAGLFIFVGCTAKNVENQVEEVTDNPSVEGYMDGKYGVSFEYPGHWQNRKDGEFVTFATDFDYRDGLSASSTSAELEGFLVYHVIQNPDGLTLSEYYAAEYEDCMAEEVAANSDFGPMCEKINFDEWAMSEIGGNTAYESDWKGVPESGEMQKRLLVDLKGKNIFVILSAVKTGITDEQSIQETAEKAFSSLRFE